MIIQGLIISSTYLSLRLASEYIIENQFEIPLNFWAYNSISGYLTYKIYYDRVRNLSPLFDRSKSNLK